MRLLVLDKSRATRHYFNSTLLESNFNAKHFTSKSKRKERVTYTILKREREREGNKYLFARVWVPADR